MKHAVDARAGASAIAMRRSVDSRRRPAVSRAARCVVGAMVALAIGASAILAAGGSRQATPSERPAERDYRVYVAAESDDTVALVRFGPGGIELEKEIPVGSFPAEIEGPHGVDVSPDGHHWFVTVAHGFPFGSLHKYETGSDEWVGDATLGMFPATFEVSPSTGLAFVVNFDLHGDMEPSTVSVVETATMTEVAQIPTGIMPHGSRVGRDGTKQYHVAMMDDELVEIDALRLEVSRVLALSEAAPSARGVRNLAGSVSAASGRPARHNEHAGDAGAAHVPPVVKPTWVTSPTRDGKVYVAGNGDSVIYEIDLEAWEVTRRFRTLAAGDDGKAPYNLDVTPDGRWLVATYKGGHAVGIWDLEAGTEQARIATTRRVPHGVVITPDARYAFVSVEGVGGEPGTVEVYDIAAGQRVATVDVGKQAGGIAFWR